MDAAKVLVVDDERDLTETLVKRLKRRGYETHGAFNGQEALALLAVSPFDVVVLDVMMPGMDGIETLREIRKRHPALGVLLLTGHASRECGAEGMSIGADDILLKPVDLKDLLKAIDQVFERYRSS